jgi:hypothetical protein
MSLPVFAFAVPVGSVPVLGQAIVVLGLLILALCPLLFVRNFWVCRVHLKHIDTVHAANLRAIEQHTYDSALSERRYHCLWSYERMLLHFWIWDPKKMVEDTEAFNSLEGAT